MKNGLNHNIYIAEGILFAFLQGIGVQLEIIKQPIAGAVILAGVIHGTVCLINWMGVISEDSLEGATDEIETIKQEKRAGLAEVTISEEFRNQPSQRSLQIKQKVEEKEARIQRATTTREEIIENKTNIRSEDGKNEGKGDTSLFANFHELLNRGDFNFLGSFEDQLLDLGVENELPENPLDKEVSLLVCADNDYAIQIRQYKDSNIGTTGIKSVLAGAANHGNMFPVVITTSGFTEEAIELAKETNVELIDGKDLEEWHNSTRKRSFEQEQDGFYECLQKKLIQRYGAINLKKTSIIVCLEEFGEDADILVDEFAQDYVKIASILLPEYEIELQFVKNEEKLPIFPLVKGNLNKDKKREVAAILKRPVLATLHNEGIYFKNEQEINLLKRRDEAIAKEYPNADNNIVKY